MNSPTTAVRLATAFLFAAAISPALRAEPERDVGAFFENYCLGCHKGERAKGNVRLDTHGSREALFANPDLTKKIVEVLEREEMPPAKRDQPSASVRFEITSQLKTWLHASVASTLPPVVMRRLGRLEYNNAVRDLLDLKGDIYPLPEKCIRAVRPYYDPASGVFPDAITVGNRTLGKNQVEKEILTGVQPFAIDLQSEHGFNNFGDELSFSPILLESFLTLGQSIVASPQFDGYCKNYAMLFAIDDKQTADAVTIARSRIAELMERAFRRPVDPNVLARYAGFFERELERTKDFAGSMKSVVAGILASPLFLYVVERAAPAIDVDLDSSTEHDAATPLSAFELATRLSLFLWSSIPDAALTKSARDGTLATNDGLDGEIRRMIKDRKSKALAENFARQWLRLDRLITAVPDPKRFVTYYSRIGCEYWKFGLQSMVEPLLLFESILVEDSSVLLLVDSDYSYRSDELQHWYTDPDPFGKKGERSRFNTNTQTYVRRKLDDRRQGGVITSAAAMTMTSEPLRTNPIARGAWVATVVLNDPPEPPPDNIPEIEADDEAIAEKGLTLRERLVEHQTKPSCSGCHSKLDPLGFALENFDAIGRWRDKYRSGRPIDASGTLFGKHQFRDIVEFKDALLVRPARFIRAFTEHLLSYALGRTLDARDEPAIAEIVARAVADRGRISTIIVEVAKSRPFRNKLRVPINRPGGLESPRTKRL